METNEYHADQPVLTLDELIIVARQMGLKVWKRNEKMNRNL